MDDVTLPIDEEMWEQRRRRLQALIGADLSDREEEPAQSDTDLSDGEEVDRIFGRYIEGSFDRPEEVDPLLYFAAKEGDVDKFIKALKDHCAKEGVSLPIVLQLTGPSKNTLLHAAAGSDTNNNTSEQDPAQSNTDPSKREQDPAQSHKCMDPLLYFGVKEGDVDKFIKALKDHCAKEGVSLPIVLQLTGPSKNTLLHAAAGSDTNNNTSEQDPAQSNADPSKQEQDPAQSDKFIDPQLYSAAKKGAVDEFIDALEYHCAEERVSLSTVLKLTSPSKNTLLHAAAESDDIVRAIIDFVPKNLISARNSRAETPLIIAARAGKAIAVERLLPQGKPRRSDCNGNTALHEAVRNRHYEVIRLLVSKEPYMSDQKKKAGPHKRYRKNDESKSPCPWCLAVETGDLKVLKCLMEAPNEGEDQRRLQEAQDVHTHGKSPAHLAIMYQRKDMLTEMWEKKPWLFKLKDANKRLPLHFAAYTNYLDGVKFMIEKFPKSVLEQDRHGYLPIHVACLMGHVGIVEELLRQWPVPAEFISRENQNILHVSARHGCISTVKYILKDPKFGHLINATDSDMNTPLHLAALHLQPSVLLLLARDRRVDLKLVNMKNMTALDAVEQDMEGMDAPLRKRLTRIILQSAGTPRSRELALCKPTVQSKGKEPEESEEPELDLFRLKEVVSNRMVVATLVASVTFASGFSVPGGYNGSDPGAGIAILLHKAMFNVFVISNSIAMYSSIIAVLILLKTQINDPYALRNAISKARIPLLVALVAMALAFMAGVYSTVTKLAWLAIVVLVLGSIALFIILSFYVFLYIPLGHTHPLVRRFTDLIIVAGISMSGSVTFAGGTTHGPTDVPLCLHETAR